MILLKNKILDLSAGSGDIIKKITTHFRRVINMAKTIKSKIEKVVGKKKEAPEVPLVPKEVEVPVRVVAPVEKVKESITPSATIKKEDVVKIKDDAVIELIPKFAEAEIKRSQEEYAEHIQGQIKKLRAKLENGSISDGEAAELFNLLAQ